MTKLMAQQGYVPQTCTLDGTAYGFMLIHAEVSAGRDPCAGCNEDRNLCHGRSKQPEKSLHLFELDPNYDQDPIDLDQEGIVPPWKEF